MADFTTKPNPPTNLISNLVEETTATVSWTAPALGSLDGYYIRYKVSSTPANYLDGAGFTLAGTSQNLIGLTRGTHYYCKVWSYKTGSPNAGGCCDDPGASAECDFVTKPDPASAFSATAVGSQINLAWTKGTGAINTMIRRNAGSYPADKYAGVEVYNGPGTTYEDTDVVGGIVYYYRAWSFTDPKYSDDYVEDNAVIVILPTPKTEEATQVGSSIATLNGTLIADGGENCNCGFEYALLEDFTDAVTTPTQVRATGETFLQVLTNLTQETLYYFRSIATNTAGTTKGGKLTFTTLKPGTSWGQPALLLLLKR